MPPAELPWQSKQARSFWRNIMKNYDLRPDEKRLLRDACYEIDLIEDLENSRPRTDFTIAGPLGRRMANPVLVELARHRNLLARLMKQIGLQDLGAEDSNANVSTNARKAAMAKWGNRG